MTAEKTYIIKEIFYSLQGEGFYTGRPAVFVRFSGCNLKCPFCDTDFKGGKVYSLHELAEEIEKVASDCRFIVFTGGEPTLQLDAKLTGELHKLGFELAMETNGTRPYPIGIDWVTVSPKTDFCAGSELCPDNRPANEVKVVYDGENEPLKYESAGILKYIQPCDTGDPERNRKIIERSVSWLEAHPDWRLSLQTQKIINVR